MIPQRVIQKKRDGLAISEEEIRNFVNGFVTGDVPEY